jgi:hypothetical protein
MKMRGQFKPGDPVIYRVTKHSRCPGPRARQIAPSPNGDDYKYLVDKFWIVDQILEDGRLLLRTRRGKTRVISRDDPNLRAPAWWESLIYGVYFPSRTAEPSENSTNSSYSSSH